MGKMAHDQQTKDLGNLAASRVSSAIQSVIQICDDRDQALQVAIMAAGAALGNATGAVTAKYGCTHDEAKAILLDLVLNNPTADAGRQALSEGEQNG